MVQVALVADGEGEASSSDPSWTSSTSVAGSSSSKSNKQADRSGKTPETPTRSDNSIHKPSPLKHKATATVTADQSSPDTTDKPKR